MVAMQVLVPLIQLSSGRRQLVYNRMRPLAVTYNVPVLTGRIDRASGHEKHTRALENEWSSRNRRSPYPGQLAALDTRLDGARVGLRDIAAGHARGSLAEAAESRLVEQFLAEVFPRGVQAITSLPFVDQIVAVEVIIDKMETTLASLVSELGLGSKLAQIKAYAGEYRDLVDAGSTLVTFAEVAAARERGQLYLSEIIAIVLGTFSDSDDPRQVATREELLAPVLEQLALTRAESSARRRSSGSAAGDEPGSDDDGSAADDSSDDSPGEASTASPGEASPASVGGSVSSAAASPVRVADSATT